MKKSWSIMIGAGVVGIVAAMAALPAHRANLDFVRSAVTMEMIKRLGEPNAVPTVTVKTTARPDVSLVFGRAVKRNTSTEGLRTEMMTSYTLNGRTKSYCLELEPGCLEIDQGPLLKSIAVKLFM